MDAAYKAFERSAALILASENWATGYAKAPIEHAKLIRESAKLERKLLVFFKDVAKEAPNKYINWHAYLMAVQEVKASRVDAYNVDVIVNDTVDDTNDQLVNIVFDSVLYATTAGAQAGESTYGIPTGLSSFDSAIQRQARKQVSQLVGKRIQPDGSVVDNPNAAYVISNTTRKRIQDSIHTSIMLGDDVQTAAKRLQKIIRDPKRAQLIAHQELGMAYTTGLHMYGQASGAVGKEWQTNGATDICATNASAGPIPFTAAYPSGDQHPTAHIGCKCYERLIYQHELDQNPNLFDKPVEPVATPQPATPKQTTPDTSHKYAVFTKNGKDYKYEMNGVESGIINNYNIELTTAPKFTTGRWSANTHGMYVEYNTGGKAMHIKEPEKPSGLHTFYHEMGHAIDHNLEDVAITDHYANQSTRAMAFHAAYTRDADALYNQRIIENYKKRGLSDEQIKNTLAGRFVLYKGNDNKVYTAQPPSASYKRYGMSPSEIFAEAYGYYRTEPSVLKKIAPNLYAVMKDIK